MPAVNDLGRAADVLSDHIGDPAPWPTLPQVS